MAQAGQAYLPGVLRAFEDSGLRYVWTMGIFLLLMQDSRPVNWFFPAWRPILVFSKGRPDLPEAVSDAFKARYDRPQLSDHQQPLEPWRYWIGKLSRPGSVIADPYCGSGTVGVATKECGGRSYIGTDIDGRAVRVARARIAATAEGSPASGR